MAAGDATRFRWSRAYGLRISGVALIVLAGSWLLAALVGFAAWAVVLVVLVAVLALGCVVRLVIWPPVLLELTDEGYRVRNARGVGVSHGPWRDVESVEGGSSPQGAVMTLQLADGNVTRVPLVLLGPAATRAERAVHDQLNTAFGYRRLEGS